MTDPEALALGRRALACKAWRWAPGVRTASGFRVIAVCTGRRGGVWLRVENRCDHDPADYIDDREVWGWICAANERVDLRDLATAGLLPAMVREALGIPGLFARPEVGEGFAVRRPRPEGPEYPEMDEIIAIGPTEPEAWIAAWEGA